MTAHSLRWATVARGWQREEKHVLSDQDPVLEQVLSAYDIGLVTSLAGAGGTAGKTWRVSAQNGTYLLRRRGTRTSSPAHLAFDHGLRAHLISRGVPTACAIRTREGKPWVCAQNRVYELYPFIAGRPFDARQIHELIAAAETLAAFHRGAHDFQSPNSWQQRVAQYTTLGFSEQVSDRMDDPRLQLINLQGVRTLAKSAVQAELVDRIIARVNTLRRTYGRTAYGRLTGYVIHGDYTPANIVYSPAGEVIGVFDFDWAMFGARCLDVAYGLCFFATAPRKINAGSIWSLTDAARFTVERCATFLQAYHGVWPLSAPEQAAIPHAFASLWISKRLEGMAKVAPSERFRFFARDIEGPLRWMDAHWAEIYRTSFQSGNMPS
jgi:Ser/Thr protein kinase RdoA (MazF antagonist)